MINEQITARLNCHPLTARTIHARLPDGLASLATVIRVLDHLASEGHAYRCRRGDRWYYTRDISRVMPVQPKARPVLIEINRSTSRTHSSQFSPVILAILDAAPWQTAADVSAKMPEKDGATKRQARMRAGTRLKRMLSLGLVSQFKDGDVYRYARRGTMIPCGWRGAA